MTCSLHQLGLFVFFLLSSVIDSGGIIDQVQETSSSPFLGLCPCGLKETPTPDPHCSCSSEVLTGSLVKYKDRQRLLLRHKAVTVVQVTAESTYCCVHLSSDHEWGMWPEPGSFGHWTCRSRTPQSAGRRMQSCTQRTGKPFGATWGLDHYQLEKTKKMDNKRWEWFKTIFKYPWTMQRFPFIFSHMTSLFVQLPVFPGPDRKLQKGNASS